MLKLRLQGPPEEVEPFANALERTGMVLERSDSHRNRSANRHVRVYMDMNLRNARERYRDTESARRGRTGGTDMAANAGPSLAGKGFASISEARGRFNELARECVEGGMPVIVLKGSKPYVVIEPYRDAAGRGAECEGFCRKREGAGA